MTPAERANLRARLVWRYGAEEADRRLRGDSPEANEDRRKWSNLGRPPEERR